MTYVSPMQMADAEHAARLAAVKADYEREIERLRWALNQIASWGEGSEVGGHFDEPHSARMARKALGFVRPADQPSAAPHDNKANVSVRCPDCDDGAYKGTDRICLTCNGLGELRRATSPTDGAA